MCIKKTKLRLLTKRFIAILLSLMTIISTTALPLTALAEGDLSEVSGASSINITKLIKYGHELHYTTVGGTSYPLFCIQYGATTPESSYLAGRKEMASPDAVEAAKWIYAGYYMVHGNSLNWLDMACCQKKVWSIMGNNVSWDFTNEEYENWCNTALENLKKIEKKPSFNNKTIDTITAGESKTIKDDYGVFKDYPAFTRNSDGIKIVHEKDSDDLVITVSKTCTKTSFAILNDTYYKNGTGNNDDLLVYYPYGDRNYQRLIYSAYYDPVSFAINGTIEPLGSLEIIKSSEDKLVSGIEFTITGSNNFKTTVKTDSTGKAKVDGLVPGDYTVTEKSISKYVKTEPQTKKVVSLKTTTYSFSNRLKKFRVKTTKKDSEKVKTQGDATLQGAKYGLYNNGKLVKTYTTDSNGEFITEYEICGSNWTLKELEPSEGYLLDETEYKIPAGAENFTIELNTIKKDVPESVIKGKIQIIKHADDGETQIETPEEGAEFQVYLKKSGSYEKADKDERDILVCDENGFAETKGLPYGRYTVHQTKAWDGRTLMNDFTVYISKDGEIKHYLINNAGFDSYLKIVKTDSETGKNIPYAGASFQLYDSDGNLIKMSYTYPTPATIDTFITDDKGCLVTPEKLPYGDYTLVETEAPYGYVIDKTPVPFTITEENSTKEGALTIVEVKKPNKPQMGAIEISKTGEMFASVNNKEGVYTPVFEEQGLPDAEFEIYAAEDIITGDGTVRAEKGALVDTIVTDEEGLAKSQPLYLGEYIVKETKAPDTFVLYDTEHEAVLTYAGQEVESTSTSLSLYNQRQTADISLTKVLEQNELYSVGMNKEIESVKFGVYSTDIITAQDESQIPAGGLITTSNCDSEGNIVFDCDLPIGFNWYVQEIETDEHYLLSDTKYDFSTEYQGQETQAIDIKINDGNEITNTLKYGEIQGKKLDDGGNALAGAVIGIFKDDTEKFTADTAVTTTVSAEDGTFSFLNIPLGTYVVKEITAPDDYLIDPNNYVIDLTDNNQIVTLEIVNVLKRGEIQGKKVDDNGNALAGAVIGLFSADTTEFTKETALLTATSADDGSFSFKDIPVGEYIVKELKSPKGYLINENNFEVSITENEQIVKIEIVNEAVKVTKKSPFTGADNTPFFISLLYTAGAMLILSAFAAKRKKEQQ